MNIGGAGANGYGAVGGAMTGVGVSMLRNANRQQASMAQQILQQAQPSADTQSMARRASSDPRGMFVDVYA